MDNTENKNLEIERKFLVNTSLWQPQDEGKRIRQGYLLSDGGRTVRVRTKGTKAFLTIKGPSNGISRLELEYEIPVADANIMLDTLCQGPLIDKTRYLEDFAGHTWEIDVFYGDNQGLVMAECELSSESEELQLPEWIEKEVSGDFRFFNSYLSRHPFSKW